MENSKFCPGQTVRHVTGDGPLMVVRDVCLGDLGHTCIVSWFNKATGVFVENRFLEVELKLVDQVGAATLAAGKQHSPNTPPLNG